VDAGEEGAILQENLFPEAMGETESMETGKERAVENIGTNSYISDGELVPEPMMEEEVIETREEENLVKIVADTIVNNNEELYFFVNPNVDYPHAEFKALHYSPDEKAEDSKEEVMIPANIVMQRC